MLIASFIFRAFAYRHFPIGDDEPYNAADVIDAFLQMGIFAVATILGLLSCLKIALSPKSGRYWGVLGLAVAASVALTCLPVHSLARRFAADDQHLQAQQRQLSLLTPDICFYSTHATPNPSVEARPNGKPPGPLPGCAYHPSSGPGALPSAPPHLER
jgi:hypothetical protein